MRYRYFSYFCSPNSTIMDIEICCNSIQSASFAKQGGAKRIELCHDLEGGGVTPSAGAIEYCVKDLGLRTRVLIRPRRGNFLYDDLDFEVIRRDVLMCKHLGAEAVVVGFLTTDGQIDKERTKEIVALAAPMEVTFHRAFDELFPADAARALEDVIECGCHKLLTSGCYNTAIEGIEVLRMLQQKANGRIAIIAASGVTPNNVKEIVSKSGVGEVHGSCKRVVNDVIFTDPKQVAALIANATQD